MFADVCICERDRLVIREIPARLLIYCVLEENCAGVGEREGSSIVKLMKCVAE
jgi:hypothetical protein